ncbi:hypothetical protein [Actinomadura sp. CNU-125]|uniref:hypothetical protein n=1 Tax=Actinomadura sp. CNU-125 TaxID=1904961 RepID=UPI001177CA85|nr:hypothetical protein [Actinomadura sp. CNU-125]
MLTVAGHLLSAAARAAPGRPRPGPSRCCWRRANGTCWTAIRAPPSAACPSRAASARTNGAPPSIDAALARAHWRIDPAAIVPLLPALRAGVRDGLVRRDDAERAVFYLMWFGTGARPTSCWNGSPDGPGRPCGAGAARCCSAAPRRGPTPRRPCPRAPGPPSRASAPPPRWPRC